MVTQLALVAGPEQFTFKYIESGMRIRVWYQVIMVHNLKQSVFTVATIIVLLFKVLRFPSLLSCIRQEVQ